MLTLEIKPEDVDQLVKEAVTRSLIGKTVTDAIAKAMGGYNSPIDEAVKKVCATVTAQLLEEKYKQSIHDAITKALADKVTAQFLDTIVGAVIDKMVRAAEGRY